MGRSATAFRPSRRSALDALAGRLVEAVEARGTGGGAHGRAGFQMAVAGDADGDFVGRPVGGWLGVALGLFAAVVHWPIKERPVARPALSPAE